jgi:hypothetical protein
MNQQRAPGKPLTSQDAPISDGSRRSGTKAALLSLPRVVLHMRSSFTADEIAGCQSAGNERGLDSLELTWITAGGGTATRTPVFWQAAGGCGATAATRRTASSQPTPGPAAPSLGYGSQMFAGRCAGGARNLLVGRYWPVKGRRAPWSWEITGYHTNAAL